MGVVPAEAAALPPPARPRGLTAPYALFWTRSSVIGEPATPPRIASARGPPEWYDDSGEAFFAEDENIGDPLAQPEPEYEFDQRVTG